jgi:hypothetical protein
MVRRTLTEQVALPYGTNSVWRQRRSFGQLTRAKPLSQATILYLASASIYWWYLKRCRTTIKVGIAVSRRGERGKPGFFIPFILEESSLHTLTFQVPTHQPG